MTKSITFLEFKAKCGELRTTVFDDSGVNLTCWGPVTITYCISREEALTLAKNLEDVVAAYDASIDTYSETKDDCSDIVVGS